MLAAINLSVRGLPCGPPKRSSAVRHVMAGEKCSKKASRFAGCTPHTCVADEQIRKRPQHPNCSREKSSPCFPPFRCPPFDHQSECPSGMPVKFAKATD